MNDWLLLVAVVGTGAATVLALITFTNNAVNAVRSEWLEEHRRFMALEEARLMKLGDESRSDHRALAERMTSVVERLAVVETLIEKGTAP